MGEKNLRRVVGDLRERPVEIGEAAPMAVVSQERRSIITPSLHNKALVLPNVAGDQAARSSPSGAQE